MAAALLHDVGKTREFTYGAEFGITEEGGAARPPGDRGGDRRRGRGRPGAGAAARRCCTASSPTTAPRPRRGAGGGRGFGTAEALALYRLNALDAGVKGALEQGL